MIETELWVSFVSLLRAYAAAAGVNNENVWVHANERKNSVTISAFAVQIEMRFDPTSGGGTWEKRVAMQGVSASSGTFAIQRAGTILINGAVKDLDHAAIELIASVKEREKETL